MSADKRVARIAGLFYVLTFVFGISALILRGPAGAAAGIAGAAVYVVVTGLFYVLFAPVNRTLSLWAMIVSLAGCAQGVLRTLHVSPLPIEAMVFFGLYCMMIGLLIFRSTYLPRALGVLMAIGGLGWLTWISPQLARVLYPYNLAPGMIGEGALTIWLVAFGVDAARFSARSSARLAV
jgi:uncharacterized protein DUF4386